MATITLSKTNIDSLPLQHRKLDILARCNPYDKHSESLLLNYYLEIKETWSKSAIDNLRSSYSLNLKKKRDRCFLANLAAKLTLKGYCPSSIDRSYSDVAQRTTQAQEKLTVNAIASLFGNDRINSSFSEKLLLDNSNKKLDRKNLCQDDSNENLQLPQQEIYQLGDRATANKVEQLEAELLSKQKELEAISQQLEERSQQLEQESAQRICLERQLEASNNQLNKQVKLNIIVATDRLLPAGPPLNGVQESPMMKIIGSPTTITELEHNYRVLEDRLLEKISDCRQVIKDRLLAIEDVGGNWDRDSIEDYRKKKDDAIERLNLVKSIYNLHRENWDLLKPTIPISDEELSARMNAKIPNGWTIESFWCD